MFKTTHRKCLLFIGPCPALKAGRGFTAGSVVLALLLVLCASSRNVAASSSEDRPNIIFILADDLGYGDLGSYGATAVRTPNIDRLAREGMRFTDAHSPHSVCTPSRYGLLTGRYAWRTWNGTLNVWSDDPLLINTSRLTLPRLLQGAGYRTALIGKWHLGFGAPGMPGWDDLKGPDYNMDLKPGPLEVGFDYFYGVPHISQHPHVIIENHRIVGLDPTDPIQILLDERWVRNKSSFMERLGTPNHKFTGGKAALYQHEDLGVHLADRAVSWINDNQHEPFFLYFAARNPHAPLRPHPRFQGTSDIGAYGDFVHELDWSIGRILDALDKRGLSERTLVIFSSDNGGVSDYKPSKFAVIDGHRINGPLFGQKTEIYEGGNRVPLLVRWPGVVQPGSTSDALVALTDTMATIAGFLGRQLPWDAAEDSFSFLHALCGAAPTSEVRRELVMDSHNGLFALRRGPWKLVAGQGGGGALATGMHDDPTDPPMQLYHLGRDLGEQINVYPHERRRAAEMAWRLKEIQLSGRSRSK